MSFMWILRSQPAAGPAALPEKAGIPRLANSFFSHVFVLLTLIEYAYYKSNQ